jgi:hypothetical protein
MAGRLSLRTNTLVSTSQTPSDESSWAERSTATGVVWAHNFDTSTEVDQFRWQGGIGNVPVLANSDGNTRWVADGFDGGGCLELNIPTGGTTNSGWWRPFSALTGIGNGTGVDDPAANGTLPLRSWNSASVNQNSDFRNGYYGHSVHQAENPTWLGQSSVWDGTDFYFQCRVKFSATRFNPSNPPGKLLFLDVTAGTGQQEVLVRSPDKKPWLVATGEFDMYTSQGNFYQSYLTHPQGGNFTSSRQPGGPYEGTCEIVDGNGGPHPIQTCWEYPVDEWVTLLFHITPGRDNNDEGVDWGSQGGWLAQVPYKDFGIEVWVAREDETEYTKIWNKIDYAWRYDSDGHHPPAFNAINASGYMNGVPAAVGWTQRYTQMIFSKEFIPCPSVAPEWFQALPNRQWAKVASISGLQMADQEPDPSVVIEGRTLDSAITAWTGGCTDQDRGEFLMVANGGHAAYAGNECYMLKLRTDIPRWYRLNDPTPISHVVFDPEGGGPADYADGRMRSVHNWNRMQYHDGKVWHCSQDAYYSPTHSVNAVWSFDRDSLGDNPDNWPVAWENNTGPWTSHGVVSGTGLPQPPGGCSALDRVTGRIFSFGEDNGGTFPYWITDTATGITTAYTSSESLTTFGGAWAVVAHDLRILVIKDNDTNLVWVMDLNNHAAGLTPYTPTNAITGDGRSGAVYHQPSKAVLTFDAVSNPNGELKKLLIPTVGGAFNPAGTFVWSTVEKLGGLSPANERGDAAGNFSKFNILEDMGNGESCLVVVTGIGDYTWVYRLAGTV